MIFDINYQTKVIELVPPNKRFKRNIGFLFALIYPLQYLRDKILGDYRVGYIYPPWVAGSYPAGAKVIYKQVVYESLVASNTDQPPSANWSLFLHSFIGVDERVKFNGQKLVLEYALNSYYQTVFRQPNLVSDIYINNLPPETVGFLVGSTVGSTVTESDTAGKTEWGIGSYSIADLVKYLGRLYLSLTNSNTDIPSDISANWHQSDTIGFSTTFAQVHNFNINVPSAVYTSSMPFAPTIEKEMRGIVDKIIPAGLNYTITPY